MLPNILHFQDSHKLLEIFERLSPFITFGAPFVERVGLVYAPNDLTLVVEVVGDCTNFAEIQNF